MKAKMRLRLRAKALEPIIRIGKNGLSQGIIDEIKKHLKKRRLIKVKILKSALQNTDRKKLAKELAEKTNSYIIEQIGLIVVLKL